MPADYIDDRLRALEHGGPAAYSALLTRMPAFALAIEGRGPLARIDTRGYLRREGHPIESRFQLAQLIASDLGMRYTIKSASRNEGQLLALARMHGDHFATMHDARQLEPTAPAAVLDAAADGLAELLLIDQSRGWLTLRPGVDRLVAPPGALVLNGFRNATKEQLAEKLTNMGVAIPPKQGQRLVALQEALRDRVTLERVIGNLAPQAREVFDIIASHGRISVNRIPGCEHYVPWSHRATPMHTVIAHGLAYLDEEQRACMWLDVTMTLNGHIFRDWNAPPFPPSADSGSALDKPNKKTTSKTTTDKTTTDKPAKKSRAAPDDTHDPQASGTNITSSPVSIPAALARFERTVEQLQISPAPVLKSGGLGVQPIRAMAKALGRPAGEVALFLALAIDLKLVGTVIVDKRGRGRNAQIDEQWRVNTQAWNAFRSPTAPQRWARLIQAWLEALYLPLEAAMPNRYEPKYVELDAIHMREAAWRLIAEFAMRNPIRDAEFCDLIVYRHSGFIDRERASTVLAEGRTLGLVTEGVTSMSPPARALLSGVDVLEAASNEGAQSFVMQGDHSVIAPPDLSATVETQLQSIAKLESDAGARIYRITEDSIRTAFERGFVADGICGFLTAHSSTGLPSNVRRTITDAAARFGVLRSGEAGTWLASDDAALLVRAVGVKATQLTFIAPNVAVSVLPERKVLELLAAKHIHVRSETFEAPHRPDESPRPPRTIMDSPLLDLHEMPLANATQLATRATALPERVERDHETGKWLLRSSTEQREEAFRLAMGQARERAEDKRGLNHPDDAYDADLDAAIAKFWNDEDERGWDTFDD